MCLSVYILCENFSSVIRCSLQAKCSIVVELSVMHRKVQNASDPREGQLLLMYICPALPTHCFHTLSSYTACYTAIQATLPSCTAQLHFRAKLPSYTVQLLCL